MSIFLVPFILIGSIIMIVVAICKRSWWWFFGGLLLPFIGIPLVIGMAVLAFGRKLANA